MTSEERKIARYYRRKARRKKKLLNFLESLPTYEQIFTFENLFNAFWLCRKGVAWKPSIQNFQQNLSTEIVKLMDQLYSSEGFKSKGFIEFNICERGKMRHIRSVDIKERVVQRCFCDNYLVPLLTHNLIYDNGASLENKGITFAINRLKLHLKTYYNKYYTNEGYILLYDFSDYFNSISHEKLYEITDPLMLDEKCRKLFHHLVDMFGDVGLGLGSQVSQVSAVAFPNQLDHFFLHQSDIFSYERYMDDGNMIFKTKEEALINKQNLFQLAKQLHININDKKIKIIKLGRSFVYLKKRFFLNDKGQVIIRLKKEKIYKHLRKTKKLLTLVSKQKIVTDNVFQSHKSWLGQAKKYKNHKSIYDIDKKIRRLLDE